MNRYLRHGGAFLVLTVMVLGMGVLVWVHAWAAPYSRENPVVQAVRKVSPAVVNINSEHEVVEPYNPFFDSLARVFMIEDACGECARFRGSAK